MSACAPPLAAGLAQQHTMDQQAVAQKAEEAKAAAIAAYQKAKEKGYFSHFNEYNESIIRPLKRVQSVNVEAVKSELIGTLTLSPPNPEANFIFYNVMALLLGIAESLFVGLILGGGFISLIWNGALGYMVAYTVYWNMLCSQEPTFMLYTLGFLVLYCLYTFFMMYSTLLLVIPACIFAVKCFCNLQMVISGYALYKGVGGKIPQVNVQL